MSLHGLETPPISEEPPHAWPEYYTPERRMALRVLGMVTHPEISEYTHDFIRASGMLDDDPEPTGALAE